MTIHTHIPADHVHARALDDDAVARRRHHGCHGAHVAVRHQVGQGTTAERHLVPLARNADLHVIAVLGHHHTRHLLSGHHSTSGGHLLSKFCVRSTSKQRIQKQSKLEPIYAAETNASGTTSFGDANTNVCAESAHASSVPCQTAYVALQPPATAFMCRLAHDEVRP